MGSDLVYESSILTALCPAVDALLAPNGSFLYVAPDTGRDGMANLAEALKEFGLVCVEAAPCPDRYYDNPLTVAGANDEDASDLCVLHFYDLAARQPHTLFHFRRIADLGVVEGERALNVAGLSLGATQNPQTEMVVDQSEAKPPKE